MDIIKDIEKYNFTQLNGKVKVQGLDGFTVTRSASKNVASPGEIINQTITIYNNSGYEVSNIVITDTISEGATFKDRSVVIGGVSYGDANPISGFNINQIIPSGNSETITYSIVMSDPMPDKVYSVNLQSNLTYNVGRLSYSQSSDVYTIDFYHGVIEIIKTSDKSVVISGQKLKFQNIVKNTGTLTNTDVFFKDTIPNGMEFIEGSVEIDSVKYLDFDPIKGFSLDTIAGKSQKVVTFEVLID